MSRITSQPVPSFQFFVSIRQSKSVLEVLKTHFNSYPLVLYVFMIGMAVDALGTIYFMTQYGTTEELNPLIRFISTLYGPIIGTLAAQAGKFVFALILVKYFGKRIEKLLWICAISSFLAGTYNTFAVTLYLRDVLTWLPL